MFKGLLSTVGGGSLTALLLIGGCSLAIETEGKQCKRDDDCTTLNPAYPQTCNPSGVCVQKEGLECQTSEACQDEDKPFCDSKQNKCVRAPFCKEDGECSSIYGLRTNICEGGACRDADCAQNTDCTESEDFGDGFECVANRCVDPVWGCIGEEDDRKAEDDEEGIFKMKVLYGPANVDTPVTGLKVTVCRSGDFNCTNPVDRYEGADTDTIQYDASPEEGWLTIRNLENGIRYNLLVEAKAPNAPFADLLKAKFMMHRPVVGETKEEKPMVMFLSFIRDMIGSSSRVVLNGSGAGLLFARLFDCNGEQLPGAVINLSQDYKTCSIDHDNDPETENVECPTTVFYFDGGNQPLLGATQTDSAGRAGAINLWPDKETVVFCHRGNNSQPYAEMSVIPPAGWITYTNIYPREF